MGQRTHLRRYAFFAGLMVSALALIVFLVRSELRGASETNASTQRKPIIISAVYSQEWDEDSDRVLVLREKCQIVQGSTVLRAQKMVIWRHTEETLRGSRDRLSVYLEGDVRVDRPGKTDSNTSMFFHLATQAGVERKIIRSHNLESSAGDTLYQRAATRKKASRRNALQQTQLTVPSPADSGPELRSVRIAPQTGALRRIKFFPRSAVPFTVLSFKSEQTTPPEQVWVLTGGINLIVEGVDQSGKIDLAADRIVVWTQTGSGDGFQNEAVQTRDTPFTVYLEGNIVIRQARSVIRASHATYDARESRALLLNAELKTYVPQLQGNLRVRAERIRQLAENTYHAKNAWTTASRFGKPGYRWQASDIFLEPRYSMPSIFSGTPPVIDPVTGLPKATETPWITSLNNSLLIEDVPVGYLPYISSPADGPNIPLRGISVGSDRIYGTFVKSTWDMFQLLGREEPEGLRWDLLANYYSRRGPGIGTAVDYGGADLFGIPGLYSGEGLAFYVNDTSKDNLGRDRRSLDLKQSNRGRIQFRHRQELSDTLTIFGEIGYLSDRNFLEQYYESEFDKRKDVETLVYIKQQDDNRAWTVLVRPQLNDFAQTTEWFPRGDAYVLSEPLLNGMFTWSTHTSAGFGKLRQAAAPTDPADIFTPIPYVANVGGAVLQTRHEVDAPFSLGPVRIVPYALGEAAFWSEDLTGNSMNRFVAGAGLRSSLLVWKVFPHVQNNIFNLNGLAHKTLFEAGYGWTDSSQDLSQVAQYNEIDDNAQERFRARFPTNTFLGAVPGVYNPRFYAVRSGAGRSVTAPYYELVDDQQVARFAIRQRLQTKVGPPDRLRIKDWMTLDLEASFFPNSKRDNFGEDFGLLGARYAWYIGDRTQFLANALYDTFENAQQLWNIGILSQRSLRGSVYLGLRQIKGGALDSRIATASFSYKMSPKWVGTLATAYDLGENRNRGQSLTLSRIGADFLFHLGTSFDASKGNTGVVISVEPRLGIFRNSQTQLSSLLQSP